MTYLLKAKLRERNEAYYAKYPEDIRNVKRLIAYLEEKDIKLPSSGNFSVFRLRQLGYYFGFHGKSYLFIIDNAKRVIQVLQTWFMVSYVSRDFIPVFKNFADIVFRCCHDLDQFGFLTRPTLMAFDVLIPFDAMPLYAVMHETIYCQRSVATSRRCFTY